MKGAFVIATIVTFAASIYGVPVTKAVDWIAVDAKVEAIHSAMKAGVTDVGNIANRDNPTVGAAISEKLAVYEKQAQAIFDTLKGAVRAKNLTPDQARSSFQQLELILTDLENNLQTDVAQLSREARGQILVALAVSRDQAERKINEVYRLLSTAIRSVDWVAVDVKLGDLSGVTNRMVILITTVAMQDNLVVGTEIARKIEASAVQANVALGKAQQSIKDRRLTAEGASRLYRELKTVHEGLRADIRDQVDQLSFGVQALIHSSLGKTYAFVEENAKEVFKLLGK